MKKPNLVSLGNGQYAERPKEFHVPKEIIFPDRKRFIFPGNKGHWCVTEAWPHKVYCSVCYSTYCQENWEVWKDGSLPRAFCPSCGARMNEEKLNES